MYNNVVFGDCLLFPSDVIVCKENSPSTISIKKKLSWFSGFVCRWWLARELHAGAWECVPGPAFASFEQSLGSAAPNSPTTRAKTGLTAQIFVTQGCTPIFSKSGMELVHSKTPGKKQSVKELCLRFVTLAKMTPFDFSWQKCLLVRACTVRTEMITI